MTREEAEAIVRAKYEADLDLALKAKAYREVNPVSLRTDSSSEELAEAEMNLTAYMKAISEKPAKLQEILDGKDERMMLSITADALASSSDEKAVALAAILNQMATESKKLAENLYA